MEKKRFYINLGFAFFPILIGIFYFMFFSPSWEKDIPSYTVLGFRFFEILLKMPNLEGVRIADEVMTVFQLACLGLISYSLFQLRDEKKKKPRHVIEARIRLAALVFIGVSLTPLIRPLLVHAVSLAEYGFAGELADVFEALKNERVFVVPLTAFAFIRYSLVYLLAILLPSAVFLLLFEKTRTAGKVMLEQILVWSFSGAVFLGVFYAANSILTMLGASPTNVYVFYASIAGTTAIMVSPVIMLIATYLLEKAMHAAYPEIVGALKGVPLR